MSFSSEVKQEAAAHISSRTGAQLAEMATILVCIGKIIPESDQTASLFVNPDNTAAVTKFFTLLEKTTNINFKFAALGSQGGFQDISADSSRRTRTEQGSRPAGRMVPLALHSMAVRELASLLDLSLENAPVEELPGAQDQAVPWPLLSDEASVRAYLRGMFLCTGMISSPDRVYRCEFVTAGDRQASQLVTLLEEHDIHVKQTRRRRNVVVYASNADMIGDILTLMDARRSSLQFQNIRLEREVRGSVNRQVNCETANIQKSVTAARRQLEDIDLLEKCGRLDSLPRILQEMARVRREHPEMSLQELGELLDPPVGRSGVNHRLRSIHEAAEEAKKQMS